MQIPQIVALLIQERDRINRAIEALQGTQARRGRPPKQAIAGTDAVPAKRITRKRTAAQRQAQAERMRAYWAKKKKAK